jgi:NAD+ synthase (glutamine-hydrolysing)
MRIALAQLNYTIGDVEGNTDKILDAVSRARTGQADLVVFSELAISGYPPKDLLDYPSFINRCKDALDRIMEASLDIGILVGSPAWSGLEKGKKLYNSAFFFENGKLLKQINKSLLPTYDIFDEYRYFEPNKEFTAVEFRGHKMAVTICEDLWNLDKEKLYDLTPMDEIMKDDPEIMINISGSPYSYNHVEERRGRMQLNARHYALPLVYLNQVGANTELLFDGGSMILNRKGEIIDECNFFSEDFKIIEWEPGKDYEDHHHDYYDYDISLIHDALIMGLKDYFSKLHFETAILGSSGGIDSAVVNALAVEALGSEKVHAVLLPSAFSSEGSVTDARELAANLNCDATEISIESVFTTLKESLKSVFGLRAQDVTEENMQARCRGIILMAMSNKFGSILLNTSNKSESAVGYTTLYGDLCGGLSVIGDLYKHQVYEMARFINRKNPVIPESIITKPPSAELRPNQKDSDSLPEYEVLDKILFHYIEERMGWIEIVELGYESSLVRRIVKLVDQNEYKRFQAPPTLRISHKAFGFGRRMPIVGKYFH